MILSKMIRASTDSRGWRARRPRSRGEPDKLGWACLTVVCRICVQWCVFSDFLTQQRQYCIIHLSRRLMRCDIQYASAAHRHHSSHHLTFRLLASFLFSFGLLCSRVLHSHKSDNIEAFYLPFFTSIFGSSLFYFFKENLANLLR